MWKLQNLLVLYLTVNIMSIIVLMKKVKLSVLEQRLSFNLPRSKKEKIND